jgi:hypothetical protein
MLNVLKAMDFGLATATAKQVAAAELTSKTQACRWSKTLWAIGPCFF